MWQSLALNLGIRLQSWLFHIKPYDLSEERSSLSGLQLRQNPDSTFSQRYPSFYGTFCPGPFTVPPSLFQGDILCQKYERSVLTIFLLPLSDRATKIFRTVCSDSGDIASIPPSPTLTGWVTLSKLLNVSTFRFLISRGGITLKAALQGFRRECMSSSV